VEQRLAALEGGEEALLFASGMAAVTTTLLTFLKAGDHIIFTDDIYRKTREFGQNFLNRFGVVNTAGGSRIVVFFIGFGHQILLNIKTAA
jgi:cystathionine gamma-synthase